MENSFEKILAETFLADGIEYTEKNLSDISVLYKMLCEYNKKINLTAITEPAAAAKKHFADSLLPIKSGLFAAGTECIDIGTGAGFPGLPLAVFLPECRFTLLDSLAKKLAFCDMSVENLKLENVKTVVSRAEDLVRKSSETREYFDIAVSRAVANLTVLAEIALPFVKVGGYFIAMKSVGGKKELEDALFAIETLGGRYERTVGDDERNLIIIKKVGNTPEKYPRRCGIPEKRPLYGNSDKTSGEK